MDIWSKKWGDFLNFPDKSTVERIRHEYPTGTIIRLECMDDVQAPPVGTLGKVVYVDDTGSLIVNWNNGSHLNVIYGVDRVSIVNKP